MIDVRKKESPGEVFPLIGGKAKETWETEEESTAVGGTLTNSGN